MEQEDIFPLRATYHRRLATTEMRFRRFLHDCVNWQSRVMGIRGPRGAGKTTLLLQHIKESFPRPDDTLWVSLDNLWFQTHALPELVDFLYAHGMREIYLDEVHKYPGWSLMVKNFYDSYPGLRIIYTGSSMLEMDNSKVDLSRRQTVSTLPVMSFREYLSFAGVVDVAPVTLAELLHDHVGIAMDIASRCQVLKHFSDYLEHGCYPFFAEAGEDYLPRLAATANLAIEADMPSVMKVTYSTVEKTKKLLGIIAQRVPLVPNIHKLGEALETTRDSCLKMLYTLDRANIVSLLTREAKSYKRLLAPGKIYLGDTNLMAALGAHVNVGNRRETFFNNQLQQVASVTMPDRGDFLVDGEYLFEVGGAHKGFAQIRDVPGSYLAVDDVETGSGNRIPLWMFGLLY